jgi:hypothetical protein
MLIGYAAFWHNDQPYGFGASLFREGWDNNFFDTFHFQAEQLGTSLHADSTMTVEEARAQLKQLSRDYKDNMGAPFYMDRKVATMILLFGNVKFLTEHYLDPVASFVAALVIFDGLVARLSFRDAGRYSLIYRGLTEPICIIRAVRIARKCLHEGRKPDFRCAMHRGLLCGTKRPFHICS